MGSHNSFDVDGIFGSLLIGCLVSCLLLGVTTAQLYLYLKKFSADPFWLRSLAFSIWTIELCHQLVFSYVVYNWVINRHMNPESLVHAPKCIQAIHVFSGLIGFTVRGFFIYRIYQFSRSKVLLGFLSLTTSVSFGVIAWPMATTSMLDNNLLLYIETRVYVIISALCASAFADMSISVSTIWVLRQRKTETIRGGLSRVLDRLIVWTWETGLTTNGLMVLSAISAGIWKNTFISAALWFVAYRAYSNTFFAALNGRISLRVLDTSASITVSRKERSALVFAALSGPRREDTNCTTGTLEL